MNKSAYYQASLFLVLFIVFFSQGKLVGQFDFSKVSWIFNDDDLSGNSISVTGDIDGDGSVDIVLDNGWYLPNDGDGNFDEHRLLRNPFLNNCKDRHDFIDNLLVDIDGAGDFNGDGLLDLIVTNRENPSSSDTLYIFINLGGEQFEQRTLNADDISGGTGGAKEAADMDGDGDIDFFTANSWWENEGEWNFIRHPFPVAYGHRVLDLTNDGLPDLIVFPSGTGEITVYLNGSGNFTSVGGSGIVLDTGSDKNIRFLDYNDDGLTDIVNVQGEDHILALQKNLGNGNFMLADTLMIEFSSAQFALRIYDLGVDNDGAAHLLIVPDCNSNFTDMCDTREVTIVNDQLASVEFVECDIRLEVKDDFNGDGVMDAIWKNGPHNTFSFRQFSDGSTITSSEFSIFYKDDALLRNRFFDFDNDGEAEILTNSSGSLFLFETEEEGIAVSARQLVNSPNPEDAVINGDIQDFLPMDLGGDGLLDVAFTAQFLEGPVATHYYLHVVSENPDGSFSDNVIDDIYPNVSVQYDDDVYNYVNGYSYENALATFDYNADGLEDLFTHTEEGIKVYMNSMNGLVTPGELIYPGDFREIEVADFNNDGWTDILAETSAFSDFYGLVWLENTDNAIWTQHILFDYNIDSDGFSLWRQIADAENDGDMDIMKASSDSDGMHLDVLYNDGDGNFEVIPFFADKDLLGSGWQNGFIVEDFDQDGNIEIVMHFGFCEVVDQQMSIEYHPALINYPYEMDSFDLDADGDLELICGGFEYLRNVPGFVCQTDLNGDGQVNIADLNILLADYGCISSCLADLDGDGITGASDIIILMGEFGVFCGE